jgi:mycothiol system anti-sigma-R factor
MEHREVLDRLTPFLDNELDPVASREVSRHLESCPSCAAAFARQNQLSETVRRGLEYQRAPELLRARVLRDVRAAGRGDAARASGATGHAWRWVSVAASVVVVAGSAWLATSLPFMAARDGVIREAVSSHVRSLMANHLTDVASTDQHTVKPWFAGKIDFSPPVTDFAAAGDSLVGGRLDYLQGRTVAALVYRHRKHIINVFVWPDAHEAASVAATRQGFHVIVEKHAGMAYCIVSDLNPIELAAFARMFTAAALGTPSPAGIGR